MDLRSCHINLIFKCVTSKTILFFLLLGNYVNVNGQYKYKTTVESNTIHVTTSTDTKNNKLPVIRIINTGETDKQISLTTVSRAYNLKGYTYTRDGSNIEKVLINEIEVQLRDNDFFEKLLILEPGKNEIIIKACTSTGLISVSNVTIAYNKPKARNYLLSIAVDNYTCLHKLKYPVENAKDLIRLLEEKYGYNSNEVIEIYNEKATPENIFAGFYQLVDSIKQDDNLIIFYASHGYYDNLINEGYWIPYNATQKKTSEYISNSSIINFIKAIKSRHTLLICDACFSGSLFESVTRGETEVNYKNFEKRQSRWAFTSGMNEEVSDESPFAKYLIQFLQENTKPKLLLTELADHVISSVSANSNQMPKLGPLKFTDHQGGQFVFHLVNVSVKDDDQDE